MSLLDCISYVTFSVACVGISFLVYAPPPGSIYSEPLTGAPDKCVNPSEPGTRPKWKNVSFYACYHANGGALFFVTVSCKRSFVMWLIVYCHM